MQTMTILWIVCGALTSAALGLLLYRAMLTRYEEDQLFLNDHILEEERTRQNILVRRINQIQPYLNVIGGAACLLAVGLVTTYTWQAWLAIHS